MGYNGWNADFDFTRARFSEPSYYLGIHLRYQSFGDSYLDMGVNYECSSV